jgi:predicted HicB family RNase H-like nuclease
MPMLSMGISQVESNHNFLIKGDKGKSHGMFQIQPRIWGKVGKSVKSQMAKHDAILLELLEACGQDVMEATKRYNGSGKQAKRYAEKVRRSALEMALLEEL